MIVQKKQHRVPQKKLQQNAQDFDSSIQTRQLSPAELKEEPETT